MLNIMGDPLECKFNKQPECWGYDPESKIDIPRQVKCNRTDKDVRCSRCGWNPAVEKERKAKIRIARQGVT